jgi:hypothetical protein
VPVFFRGEEDGQADPSDDLFFVAQVPGTHYSKYSCYLLCLKENRRPARLKAFSLGATASKAIQARWRRTIVFATRKFFAAGLCQPRALPG